MAYARLLGLLILVVVAVYDYWAWSSLFGSVHIGAALVFLILAIISIPITIFGGIGGLMLLLGDD